MELRAIERWTMPDSYFGKTYEEYYVAYGRHRDSDILVNSNFDCLLKAIGGTSKTVLVESASHWAVGWVEHIFIHESDTEALEKADDCLCALSGYPVLNDTDYSQRCCDATNEFWVSLSTKERMEYCEKVGVSVYAARRDDLPDGNFQDYFDIH